MEKAYRKILRRHSVTGFPYEIAVEKEKTAIFKVFHSGVDFTEYIDPESRDNAPVTLSYTDVNDFYDDVQNYELNLYDHEMHAEFAAEFEILGKRYNVTDAQTYLERSGWLAESEPMEVTLFPVPVLV